MRNILEIFMNRGEKPEKKFKKVFGQEVEKISLEMPDKEEEQTQQTIVEHKVDLEDRIDKSVAIAREPMHTNPIEARIGNYVVKTYDINKSTESYFHLNGYVSLSRIAKAERKEKTMFGEKKIEEEFVEWTSEVPAKPYDRQLYHPREIAKVMVQDLRARGVIVNQEKTEEFLCRVLLPYVNSALHHCVDRGICKPLGRAEQKLEDELPKEEQK